MIAAVLALSLFPWAGGTGIAAAFGLGSAPARSSAEKALAGLLAGSAITFAERSKPWIEALGTVPEDEQRERLTDLLRVLLDEHPERSTRACVLLGAIHAEESLPASTRGASQDALVFGLTQRRDMGERWKISADVVAARALDVGLGSPEERAALGKQLTELAHGGSPHPHLAVRVECAASALKLKAQTALNADLPSKGQATETTAFLLAVLRAETPDQVKSPRTWPRITTLAWVKTRAAEALALWTATDNRFRPDGSWAHQVAEAARFESLLR